MRSSEVKTICGRCGVFLGPNSSKTTFPPTFWATLRGWQLLTLKKKKKCTVEEAKRIIFKKEHNLTFLSATHSTPPPHSLVSPPASLPFHSPSPASLPGCARGTTPSRMRFLPVSQAGRAVRTPHRGERLRKDSGLPPSWEEQIQFLLKAPDVWEPKPALTLWKPCLDRRAIKKRRSISGMSQMNLLIMSSS